MCCKVVQESVVDPDTCSACSVAQYERAEGRYPAWCNTESACGVGGGAGVCSTIWSYIMQMSDL